MSRSQLYKQKVSCLGKFTINVVKCGQVPRHIAFLMDGNRRYYKSKGLTGNNMYQPGAAKMYEIIHWCYLMGVKEVSMYAFSILNFGRPKDQVETFINQMKFHIQEMYEDIVYLNQLGCRVNIVGNLDLFDKDMRKLSANLIMATRNNTNLFLNLFLAYTFTHELGDCVKAVAEGVQAGLIEVDDIDEKLLYDSLYTNFEYPPDIVVRSSGPKRLSDFLMWQLGNANIYFIDELWPAITLWRFLQLIFDYQLSLFGKKMVETKVEEAEKKKNQTFWQEIHSKRISVYNSYRNL